MNKNFLKTIRGSVEKRVSALPDIAALPINELKFTDIFNQSEGPVIISEIKFSTPSAGVIYHGKQDHLAIAADYIDAGASALSILTEPDYFQGNIDFIGEIRARHPDVHLLMKDFVITKKQIGQALLQGANAILLIVALLEPAELKELYEVAIKQGLTPIIEVHNETELELALRLSPEVIGINNRCLRTLKVSLDTARSLIKKIPDGCHAVCESGIAHASQIQEMQGLGFRGFLMGSSLMQCQNPGLALSKLYRECANES